EGAALVASPLGLLSDDAASQLGPNRLVSVQNIDAARNLVVHDVVLAGDAHGNLIHDLHRSPTAEFGNVDEIGSHEGERFRVEENALRIESRYASPDLDDCLRVC